MTNHATNSSNEVPLSGKRGVVGVLVSADRLLMIQRSQLVRAPGKFCFPGGTIEEGESQSTALRRELMEELSLSANPLHELWTCVTEWGTQLSWWLVDCPAANIDACPNPAEVSWCGWMTIEEILSQPELLSSNRHFLAAYLSGVFSLPISD